jgi:hypothetical protein
MHSSQRLRLLALIHPLEEHVGHWAASSLSLHIQRILMEDPDLETRILQAVAEFQPQAIALTSKSAPQYLDILDALAGRATQLRALPRIFRCQNTMLRQRFGPQADDKDLCRAESGWFRIACDPRWSLVLVQTLDDVALIRRHLAPTAVAACPYGYDPVLFDPDLPEQERPIDVGCYMNLKDIPGRKALVEAARRVCKQHGFTFHFASGTYGEAYVELIRATKILLHWSEHGEIPYRMYEATALGALFLSNRLGCGVEQLFTLGEEYMIYQEDLSDLEGILLALLQAPERRKAIAAAGQARAQRCTWPHIAERYVVPTLRRLLAHQPSGETLP